LGVRGNWAGKNHSRRIRSVTKEVTLAKNHHLPFMSPQQRTSTYGYHTVINITRQVSEVLGW